jgi:hypothetical protein
MALIDLYLDDDYKELIQNIYKVLVILILFHLILSNSGCNKNTIMNGLMGKSMNDDFLGLCFIIILSIMGYYLVIERIIMLH